MRHIDIINSISDRISRYDTIGVFSSGGFDSTVTLYLVTKIITEQYPHKNLLVYTVNRTDDSKTHSERVVSHMSRIFDYTYTHITGIGDPGAHHSRQVSSGIKQVLHPSTLLILGDTINPDEPSLSDGPVRVESTYDHIYQPFIGGDKTVTISVARELGILELVSTISHTCTESIELRCGVCWQCRERSWAFNVTGLVDVGAM